ncbi:MAG: hypothetical protein JSR31_01190 [Nitrospira sp.]|nr:hypothetical protein [Nitrospira sp.]
MRQTSVQASISGATISDSTLGDLVRLISCGVCNGAQGGLHAHGDRFVPGGYADEFVSDGFLFFLSMDGVTFGGV